MEVNNNGDVDDVYTLEFSENEHNENHSDKINNNDHDITSSPRFEIVKKVEVTQGMLITTRQVTNTFFQQIVPSQTVIVYINPTGADECCHEMTQKEEVHVLKKINPRIESILSSILGPWRKLLNILCFIPMLLLMHCVHQEGNSNKNQRSDGECKDRRTMLMMKNGVVRRKTWKKKKDKDMVDEEGLRVQDSFKLKKLGLSLAIILAVSFMCLM